MSRIQREKLRLIQESNRRLLNEQVPSGRPGEGDYNEMINMPNSGSTQVSGSTQSTIEEAITDLLERAGNMDKRDIIDDLAGMLDNYFGPSKGEMKYRQLQIPPQ